MNSSIVATSRGFSRPCIPMWFGQNGMEGGHVHGRDEVRSYWKRQWAILDPHVEPVDISPSEKGEAVVKVHQVVHDPKGNLLADKVVIHVFQIQNGLIQRFDIRDE